MPPLKLVPPAEPEPIEQVRQRVRALPKPSTMLQCPRCGGREMIETKIGMLMKNGRPMGGTKRILCASCLAKGEKVVVM